MNTFQRRQIPYRRWLPVLCFFTVGFDYRFGGDVGPSLAVLEPVAMLSIFVWFLDLVWNCRLIWNQTIVAAKRASWVVAYFSWAFVTIWLAFFRTSTDNLFAFRNLFPSLIIFFVVIEHVRERKDVMRCLWAYLMGVCINLALAISQKIMGFPYPNPLHEGALVKMDLDGGFVTNTPSGFFVHPNGLAIYLLPAVIIAFYGKQIGMFRGWLSFPVQLCFAAVSLVVMYLTYAKGSLLWVGLAIMMCYAPRLFKRNAGWMSAAALSVIPVIIFIGTDPFHLGIRTLNSMMTRFQIWESALRTMVVDPYVVLFGNGFQTIYELSLRLSDLPYLNAHNNFLNQVIFFGLPALILYILGFSHAIRKLATAIRLSQGDHILVCIVAILTALIGEHFFEPVLDSVALQGQYYAFLALALAVSAISTKESMES